MRSIHRSILARTLMTGAASLAFTMMSAGEVHAETVLVQGADGANAVDGNPNVPATSGESVTATAGSTQPVTDPSNSAFATGGNGGNGGNNFGNGTGAPGGGATATAATTVVSGSAEAAATATGGNGGNFGAGGFENHGYGGFANAGAPRRPAVLATHLPRRTPPAAQRDLVTLVSQAAPTRPPTRRRRAAERRLPPQRRRAAPAIQSALHLIPPMQRRTPRP
jgi:hypothetical protein